MTQLTQFVGVDYGSKLAGTTAVAFVSEERLKISQSQRGQNADDWLCQLVNSIQPKVVFIDAPLTLPKVYSQGIYTSDSEYFYRACDREVQAMSPMFIGGLTARALQLRARLSEVGISALETYPSQLAKILFKQLAEYKKSLTALPLFTEALQGLLPISLYQPPANWHQFDSLLAWYSGYRHSQGQSILYGDAKEGRIIV
ncbi:DUF429 domain-containing protein [Pontibacter cellulosilyticus]|uniref:DUF429 domain-containing protein n=1 Tax=Pontibacter cellulosilyticus TaxID=1720253 RepID=A0A923N4M1_9BACT|nr:DUF429 domain-containing protein [Pontibacter cellulosilyticus]MBC5992136.1 DUF429 domain-containing protein [Pontibacter cellulosilyticus]